MNSKQQFELRKAHHLITSLGTKVAIGVYLDKNDIDRVNRAIKLFKEVKNYSALKQLEDILLTMKKRHKIRESGLTLL